MSLTKHSRNTNDTYGPTKRGDYYISKIDHRRTSKRKKGKTRWAIEEGQEFSVFQVANDSYNDWFCNVNNCIFSIIDKGNQELGENGERIAKFPNDRNCSEPWHGYPVSSSESQNRPSSDVLDILVSKEIIPLHLRLKIEKGLI